MFDKSPINRKLVIVIDDDSELRAMLSELLHTLGYNVYSSDDAYSVYDLARSLRPAAILCDVVLPRSSGFDAAVEIRRHTETRKIPFILMTGYGQILQRRETENRWLMKPFTTEDLSSTLEKVGV